MHDFYLIESYQNLLPRWWQGQFRSSSRPRKILICVSASMTCRVVNTGCPIVFLKGIGTRDKNWLKVVGYVKYHNICTEEIWKWGTQEYMTEGGGAGGLWICDPILGGCVIKKREGVRGGGCSWSDLAKEGWLLQLVRYTTRNTTYKYTYK